MAGAEHRPDGCRWCGRPIPESGAGRPRRYCRRSCRQRAYEHRAAAGAAGLPRDAVVLSAGEADALAERAFRVRCAAEDVATALAEGADPGELQRLCAALLTLARDAERIR